MRRLRNKSRIPSRQGRGKWIFYTTVEHGGVVKKVVDNRTVLKKLCQWTLLAAVWLSSPGQAAAAPAPDLWRIWLQSEPNSITRVDHALWDGFLKKYVIANHPSGIYRVHYAQVSKEDRTTLQRYVHDMQQVVVTRLNRNEQKAYWVNLYNALTVQLVLEHYPVKSIRDINISPGIFSKGPWQKKLLTIQAETLSLDDIEHRILRPIWKDNRIHYAVNCASLGCPNLLPEAFSTEKMEAQLDRSARDFINHPRGVAVEGKNLKLSKIYDWFNEDFSGSSDGVIQHLSAFAAPDLARALANFRGKITYDYDWRLNE